MTKCKTRSKLCRVPQRICLYIYININTHIQTNMHTNIPIQIHMHTYRYTCIHICIHIYTQVHIQHLCVASAVLDTEDIRERDGDPGRGHPGKQTRTKQCDTAQNGTPVFLPPLPTSRPTIRAPVSSVKEQLLPALAGGGSSD